MAGFWRRLTAGENDRDNAHEQLHPEHWAAYDYSQRVAKFGDHQNDEQMKVLIQKAYDLILQHKP